MLRPAVLALVLLAPLALGAAPVWAWSSLAVLLALLVMAQGGRALAGAGPRSRWPLPRWTAGPIAVLAGLALWQLTAGAPVHPLRLRLADALDDPAAMLASPILHRAEAADAVVRIASPAALAWLTAQIWTGARVRPALAALTLVGACVAAYGLAAHALDFDRVLWLAGPFYPSPTGPFVARGAFAAYLTLAMLAAAALWIARDAAASGLAGALAWTVMAAALVASQSRAGLAAALAAHLLLFALAARGGWLSPRAAAGWALGVIAATGIAGVAAGLDGRMADLPDDLAHRLAVWRTGVAAVADRPWTGHGLGSFPHLFEVYRTPAAAQPVASAHSLPLEWAAELGLPGAAALLAVLLGTAAALLRAPATGGAVLAALPALAAVTVQGAVDPGPQVPAVTLTAGLLVGLGLSRSPGLSRGPAGRRRPLSHPEPP